ncbi:hypothetical protein BGZ65_012257, partial [Modicella reniformis]
MRATVLSTLAILTITTLLSTLATAAPPPGFCGDCQTFANAIAPCGSSFGPTDIEINGTYIPPQAAAKCICSDILQKVLWTCAKCEFLAGFGSKSQPPQAYQTQCMAWGVSIADWRAAYAGTIAVGTTTPMNGANPVNPGGTSGTGSSQTGGSGTSPGEGTVS